jgi:hypothetical protein
MRREGLRGKKAEAWEWEYVMAELGPPPLLGIANVPLDEATLYGCGDADFTGMVAARLEEGRSDPKYKVEREDWDK